MRLRCTATWGAKLAVFSSWYELTSTTRRPFDSAAGVSTASESGVPRLPPTKVAKPAALKISPMSVVTVLLPLVPVIATMGARVYQLASSSSLTTGTPRASAASTTRRGGTPGDTTIRSAFAKVSGLCAPRSKLTPACASAMSFSSSRSAASRLSLSTTEAAPLRSASRAADSPEAPMPTTTTRLQLTVRSTRRGIHQRPREREIVDRTGSAPPLTET